MCILQSVSRVAHVHDSVEDLREDWPDIGGVYICGIVVVIRLKGGAVYISRGGGTFTDCTFTSNTAVSR